MLAIAMVMSPCESTTRHVVRARHDYHAFLPHPMYICITSLSLHVHVHVHDKTVHELVYIRVYIHVCIQWNLSIETRVD